MKLLSIIAIVIAAAGCNESSTSNNNEPQPKPVEVASEQGMEKAYFASGCFWCVEEIYESVIGVNEAVSGYAGGKDNNPTYRNHGDHAEAVEVQYDPTKVTFKTLVDVYFASQYIEQKNGQGPDNGHSYRSIIFYQNDAQKKIINDKIAALTKEGYEVAAEVKSFQKFWIAEDYHQDYAKLNPNQGYIQSVSIPRFKRFAAKMPQVIKPNARH